MGEVFETLGDWAFILATVGAITFVALYALTSPWWKSPMGKHVMIFMGVIAVILGLVTLRLVWEYPGVQYLKGILYSAFAGVIWWRVGILIHVQILRKMGHDSNPYGIWIKKVSRPGDDGLDSARSPNSSGVGREHTLGDPDVPLGERDGTLQ